MEAIVGKSFLNKTVFSPSWPCLSVYPPYFFLPQISTPTYVPTFPFPPYPILFPEQPVSLRTQSVAKTGIYNILENEAKHLHNDKICLKDNSSEPLDLRTTRSMASRLLREESTTRYTSVTPFNSDEKSESNINMKRKLSCDEDINSKNKRSKKEENLPKCPTQSYEPDVAIHKCKYCNKILSTRSALAMHTRIHTGQKPYLCSICTRRFRDPSTLSKHRRVHTNEKPYSCNVCGKSFSQSGNMYRHKATAHPSDINDL